MSAAEHLAQFDQLSAAERILFVQDLWDRIAAQPEQIDVTAEQRGELDRRLAAHDASPEEAKSWEEAKKEIRRPR